MPVDGAWTYVLSGDYAIITDYNTSSGYEITIPETLDGYTVSAITANALATKSLTSLTIDVPLELRNRCFMGNSGIQVTIDEDITTNILNSNYVPFRECAIADKAIITNNVTSIPHFLFAGCGLTEISLPTSLTTLGWYAFANNSISSTIEISNIDTFNISAFENNYIPSVTLDHEMTLYNKCFGDNPGIDVTLDYDIDTYISSQPFYNCSIGTDLTITNNVTTLPDRIFQQAGLTEVSLPTSLIDIGYYAFANNSISSTIEISNVTSIKAYAFDGNSIPSIDLDHSITLYYYAFRNNVGIDVTVDDDILTYGSAGVFEQCEIGADVTITNNVTSIPDRLFQNAGLTEITLPTSLLTIGDYAFATNDISNTLEISNVVKIESYAFYDNSIPDVDFDHAMEVQNNAFSNNVGIDVIVDANITTSGNYGVFENCLIGADLTITTNVSFIDDYFFQHAGLTELSLPTTCNLVGISAFKSNSITELSFSNEMTVSSESFGTNRNLNLTLDVDLNMTGSIGAFKNCNIQDNILITDNVTSIDDYLLHYAGITSIELSENVNSIGANSLSYNEDLVYIYVYNPSMTFGTDCLITNMSTLNPGIIFGYISSTAQTYAESIDNYIFAVLDTLDIIYPGQYIKIYLNSELKFSGIANSCDYMQHKNGIGRLKQEVRCVGLNNIPTRRTIKIDYSADTTASDIVSDMIDDYLSQEGIEAGEIDNGIVFDEEWTNEIITISDVLDECAAKSGYQWFIDKYMKLNFYQEPTTISNSTFTLESGGRFLDYRNIRVNETIDNYVNKVFVVGGNDWHGDIIYTVNGDIVSQNQMQSITAGSGVYGLIHRDSAIVEHDYKFCEAGTNETTIYMTAHGMNVNDWFWNVSQDAYSVVTDVLDADSFECESVTSQASDDTLEIYVDANSIGNNIIKRQSDIPQTIEFSSFSTEFEPQTKLICSLIDIRLVGYYNIESVNISDRGNNTFETKVRAIRKIIDDFSTQQQPGFTDYFRGF